MSDTGYPSVVGIDAEGNIVVQGIDLIAVTAGTPSNQDRIRWIRQSDGAVAAEIVGSDVAGISVLDLIAHLNAGDTESRLLLQATQGKIFLDGDVAIYATSLIGLTPTRVTVFDNAGESSFAQLRTPQARILSSGTVSAAGGILVGTGDFSVTHTGTGNYSITWGTAFPSLNGPNIIVCSYDVRGLFWRAIPVSDTVANIEATNSVPAGVDSGFSFIAIG